MLKKPGIKEFLKSSFQIKVTLNCKICHQEIDPSVESYYFLEHTYFVKGKEHDSDGLFIHEKCYGQWKK